MAIGAAATEKIGSFEEALAATNQPVLARTILQPDDVLEGRYLTDIRLNDHLRDELYELVFDRLTDNGLLVEIALNPTVRLLWRKVALKKLNEENLSLYVRQAGERLQTGGYEYRFEALLDEARDLMKNTDAKAPAAAPQESRLRRYGLKWTLSLLLFGIAGLGLYRISGHNSRSVKLLCGVVACGFFGLAGWEKMQSDL